MIEEGIHSCSYYCRNPKCIEAQRDELRDRLERGVNVFYDSGWNSALELVANRLRHEFKLSFPTDTVDSFAIYIKGFKK